MPKKLRKPEPGELENVLAFFDGLSGQEQFYMPAFIRANPHKEDDKHLIARNYKFTGKANLGEVLGVFDWVFNQHGLGEIFLGEWFLDYDKEEATLSKGVFQIPIAEKIKSFCIVWEPGL